MPLTYTDLIYRILMPAHMTLVEKRMDSRRVVEKNDAVYDDGCLRVEHNNYYVVCQGQLMKFTRAEFLLLSRLTSNPNRFVESEELWSYAWGEDKPYNAQSMHVHMYRLRSKFEPFGIRIECLVGVGYRISLASCCQARTRMNRK